MALVYFNEEAQHRLHERLAIADMIWMAARAARQIPAEHVDVLRQFVAIAR